MHLHLLTSYVRVASASTCSGFQVVLTNFPTDHLHLVHSTQRPRLPATPLAAVLHLCVLCELSFSMSASSCSSVYLPACLPFCLQGPSPLGVPPTCFRLAELAPCSRLTGVCRTQAKAERGDACWALGWCADGSEQGFGAWALPERSSRRCKLAAARAGDDQYMQPASLGASLCEEAWLAVRRGSLLALVSLVGGKVLEHIHLLQQELEALVALLLLRTQSTWQMVAAGGCGL